MLISQTCLTAVAATGFMLCAAPVASADQNMYLNELQGKLFVSLTNNQALQLGNAACGAMRSAINSGMSIGKARHQGDLAVANAAQADGDQMYLVGTDIQPGEYQYTVDSFGIGSWMLCATANCDVEDIISMDQIFDAGHTGYFTVAPGTKYVKINELNIAPA